MGGPRTRTRVQQQSGSSTSPTVRINIGNTWQSLTACVCENPNKFITDRGGTTT